MTRTEITAQPEPLMTINDLGAYTGWSTSSIYRRRSLGEDLPPAVRLGSQLRWRREDVERWAAERLEPARD